MTLLEQREQDAEQIRHVAVAVFVAALRDYAHAHAWNWVLMMLSQRFSGCGQDLIHMELGAFANLYGWPDTLRAVAQAMQADEIQQRELEARR